jgi:hypothetical protein
MTLDTPETLAAPLNRAEAALPRVLLEGFAAEAYRQGILSAAQVRVLMTRPLTAPHGPTVTVATAVHSPKGFPCQ